MAFDGSIEITLIDKCNRLAKVVVSGFDADGENLIDLLTLTLDSFYDIGIRRDLKIKTITWWLLATHATAVTDVVSFKLMMSIRPGGIAVAKWIELGEITDADVDNGGTAAEDSADVTEAAFPTQEITQFDGDCITVGAGNTLALHMVVGFGE